MENHICAVAADTWQIWQIRGAARALAVTRGGTGPRYTYQGRDFCIQVTQEEIILGVEVIGYQVCGVAFKCNLPSIITNACVLSMFVTRCDSGKIEIYQLSSIVDHVTDHDAAI